MPTSEASKLAARTFLHWRCAAVVCLVSDSHVDEIVLCGMCAAPDRLWGGPSIVNRRP